MTLSRHFLGSCHEDRAGIRNLQSFSSSIVHLTRLIDASRIATADHVEINALKQTISDLINANDTLSSA